MATLARLIDKSTFLTLITDGEKSYGARLFEVCHEMIMTGKPGRPKKTLKKGVRVALKNKGKQNHKKGPKKKKYERPWPEHPDTNSFIENREIQANRLGGCGRFDVTYLTTMDWKSIGWMGRTGSPRDGSVIVTNEPQNHQYD